MVHLPQLCGFQVVNGDRLRWVHRVRRLNDGVIVEIDQRVVGPDQTAPASPHPIRRYRHALDDLALNADAVFPLVRPLDVRVGHAVQLRPGVERRLDRADLVVLRDVVAVGIGPRPAVAFLPQGVVQLREPYGRECGHVLARMPFDRRLAVAGDVIDAADPRHERILPVREVGDGSIAASRHEPPRRGGFHRDIGVEELHPQPRVDRESIEGPGVLHEEPEVVLDLFPRFHRRVVDHDRHRREVAIFLDQIDAVLQRPNMVVPARAPLKPALEGVAARDVRHRR